MQPLLRMFYNNCISLTTARDLTLSVELLLGASYASKTLKNIHTYIISGNGS